MRQRPFSEIWTDVSGDTEQSELMAKLADGTWDDDIIESLRSAADDFKQTFSA